MSEEKPVILVEYNDEWPMLFEEEKARLLNHGGELVVEIEHIGSTSVPGLTAKPIVDILLGVRKLDDAVELIESFSLMGYKYAPQHEDRLPERRFMSRTGFHLHMTESGNLFWSKHVFFRDYLRAHTKARNEYAQLKLKLAEKYRNDRSTYTDSKAGFINSVLKKMP